MNLDKQELLFKIACKRTNISIEEGRKYEKEINTQLEDKFKKPLSGLKDYDFTTKIAMGLFIKSLGRGDLTTNKIKFSGSYFTSLFYDSLRDDPKEKEIAVRIETIECGSSKIWTIKNMVPCLINKENVNKKIYEIEEKNTELDEYFPNGYVNKLNPFGYGLLISAKLVDNVDDKHIHKRKATCTGLVLAIASKEKFKNDMNNMDENVKDLIVTWKWNIGNLGTSLDLDLFKSYLPQLFHSPEFKLNLSDFFYLCSILGILFNLQHIEIAEFAEFEELAPRGLLGIRDIAYK
jgi:hypothetical protein